MWNHNMICRPGMQYDVVFTVEFWFKYLGSGRCHKIDEHSQENIHPNIARIYSDLLALYWHCDHVLVALALWPTFPVDSQTLILRQSLSFSGMDTGCNPCIPLGKMRRITLPQGFWISGFGTSYASCCWCGVRGVVALLERGW